jgi:hypothetical protein
MKLKAFLFQWYTSYVDESGDRERYYLDTSVVTS